MATIAENLQKVRNVKSALMTSINAKNEGAITNSTPFSAYPNAIDTIEIGGVDMSDKFVSGCLEIKDYSNSEFMLSSCVKDINIPESVISLGDNCFKYCSGLTSVTIPNSVVSLGNSCFYYCSSLTGIIINDSVTSLGNKCFYRCSSLTCVTIGNSVTSIGSSCFEYCSGLKSVTCKATTPPTLVSSAFYDTHSTMVIYVPAESVAAYKSATNWRIYADQIQAIA